MIKKETGFTLDKTEDIWKIHIDIGQFGENMQKKMEKIEVDHITFSVVLPKTYPIDYPFVSVHSPMVYGGYIQQGGSICLELITKSGWTPMMNIIMVIRSIIQLFEESSHSIKLGTYDINDAVKGHKWLTKTHSW